MIRHVVMWRVAGDTPAQRMAARQRIKVAFERLNGRVPGLLALHVGEDISGVDYACDLVLVSDFESPEALRAYATHAEHLAAKQAVEGLRITRHQVDFIYTARGTA